LRALNNYLSDRAGVVGAAQAMPLVLADACGVADTCGVADACGVASTLARIE
jgi:hypothetical protein